MQRSVFSTAALLGGLLLAVATSPVDWTVASEPHVTEFSLEAGDCIPLDLRVSANAAGLRSFDEVWLSVTLDGVNDSASSGLLGLWLLPEPWSCELPDDAILLSEQAVRGYVGGEPFEFSASLGSGEIELERDLHLVVLVEDGEPVLSGELIVVAQATSRDQPEKGAALLLEVL